MKKLGILIVFLVIIFHHLARLTIFSAVAENKTPIEVLPFFNLVEVWNRGMSFGLFHNFAYGQCLLSGFAITVVIALLIWQNKIESKVSKTAIFLIIGGALGNVLDRLLFGAVADYLDFNAFGYHWPAFNLTDTAICTGAVLLLLSEKINQKNELSV